MQPIKPAFGYVLVRLQEPGKTQGGIIAGAHVNRWFVVEASEGHMQEGHLVPCTLKEGDEIIPIPKVKEARFPDGRVERKEEIQTLQGPRMPRNHHILKLSDICAMTPKADVEVAVEDDKPRVQLAAAGDMPKGPVH